LREAFAEYQRLVAEGKNPLAPPVEGAPK
jgi:hypothetical protein